MACKICNRSSCTESFHSIDEQREHEESASRMVDDLKRVLADTITVAGRLRNQRDELADLLLAAVRRIELSTKDGVPILGAWLPDAIAALAKLKKGGE